MKKILLFAVGVMAMCAISSCGGADTPASVAENSIECLKNKDYSGYVDLLDLDLEGKSSDEIKSTKLMYAGLLKSKFEETSKKDGDIKDYKVVSEEVQDSVASVKMAVIFENKVDTMDVSLKKDKSGDWKIQQKK